MANKPIVRMFLYPDTPDPPQQGEVSIPLPDKLIWSMLESLALLGEDRTVQRAQCGIEVSRAMEKQLTPHAPGEEVNMVRDARKDVVKQVLGGNWQTPDDRALALTHRMVHAMSIGWGDAAVFASGVGQRVVIQTAIVHTMPARPTRTCAERGPVARSANAAWPRARRW